MANHLELCEIILSSEMLTTMSRGILNLIFCSVCLDHHTHPHNPKKNDHLLTTMPRVIFNVICSKEGGLIISRSSLRSWSSNNAKMDMRGNVDHDNDQNKTGTSTKTSPDCLETPSRKFPLRDSDRWVRWEIEHKRCSLLSLKMGNAKEERHGSIKWPCCAYTMYIKIENVFFIRTETTSWTGAATSFSFPTSSLAGPSTDQVNSEVYKFFILVSFPSSHSRASGSGKLSRVLHPVNIGQFLLLRQIRLWLLRQQRHDWEVQDRLQRLRTQMLQSTMQEYQKHNATATRLNAKWLWKSQSAVLVTNKCKMPTRSV